MNYWTKRHYGTYATNLIGVFGLNSSEIWTPAVLLVEAGGPVLYTSTTLPDIVQESTLTVLVQEHPW